MNGHTDSRERGCTRQLLAKEGQEEGYWASPGSQESGSWVPVPPRDGAAAAPWECLLLGRQSQGPSGPGMCLYDSTLG